LCNPNNFLLPLYKLLLSVSAPLQTQPSITFSSPLSLHHSNMQWSITILKTYHIIIIINNIKIHNLTPTLSLVPRHSQSSLRCHPFSLLQYHPCFVFSQPRLHYRSTLIYIIFLFSHLQLCSSLIFFVLSCIFFMLSF
jgi:hypothetical protein